MWGGGSSIKTKGAQRERKGQGPSLKRRGVSCGGFFAKRVNSTHGWWNRIIIGGNNSNGKSQLYGGSESPSYEGQHQRQFWTGGEARNAKQDLLKGKIQEKGGMLIKRGLFAMGTSDLTTTTGGAHIVYPKESSEGK